MTRAVVFDRYGEPDVLELVEVVEAPLDAGQIRVRVQAAGVQPFDCILRSGTLDGYVPVTFPQRLGNEFSGVIAQVGEGVKTFDVGDEVLGFTYASAYADSVIVGDGELVKKPAALSFELAGVLSASGQTALAALDELVVGAGDVVLIHAAAGGVGTFAVQLAVDRGATVIGTASEHNHDYLRALGALPVSYEVGLVDRVRALAPRVDVALDLIGGVAIDASLELVADRDRIGTTAEIWRADQIGIRAIRTVRSQEKLAALAELAAAGELQVPLTRIPIADVARAHRLVEDGHVRGKVVLIAGG